MKNTFLILVTTTVFCMGVNAQEAITIVGGDARSEAGILSLSCGEVAVQHSVAKAITVVNITSYYTEGVQQGFGIINNDITTPLSVNITVGPNPTHDWVEVNVTEQHQGLNMTLFSIKGEVIMKSRLEGEKAHIEMGNLPAGTYLLNIESENHSGKNTYKIIKAN